MKGFGPDYAARLGGRGQELCRRCKVGYARHGSLLLASAPRDPSTYSSGGASAVEVDEASGQARPAMACCAVTGRMQLSMFLKSMEGKQSKKQTSKKPLRTCNQQKKPQFQGNKIAQKLKSRAICFASRYSAEIIPKAQETKKPKTQWKKQQKRQTTNTPETN